MGVLFWFFWTVHDTDFSIMYSPTNGKSYRTIFGNPCEYVCTNRTMIASTYLISLAGGKKYNLHW
jgi:hypothetical protein